MFQFDSESCILILVKLPETKDLKMNFKKLPLFLILMVFTLNPWGKTTNSNLQVLDLTISIDSIVAGGFSLPVQVTHSGDNSGRLFVVEQGGLIKIIQPDSSVSTYLDIHTRLTSGGERGLLGLAFHPNYINNGYFYVDYTDLNGDTTVSRFQVSADPNQALATSELVLFKVAQPYSNHNGGQLLFGPDGYLYISLGDGGSGGDPLNNGQNLSTPLGKILRIDVDQGNPYSIPTDNPFYGDNNADERIWVWGLRNPWRFSFDRLSGDLFIGDVGQNLWEEIDIQDSASTGGENYGWRCLEGNHVYSTSAPCDSSSYLSTLIPPITEYSHTIGHSVTGGFVYRGENYPAFSGTYFFADYVDGIIFSLQNSGTGWVQTQELGTGLLISSFGEDQNGELYIVDYGGGNIRRLIDPNVPTPNLDSSRMSVNLVQADPGETLTYTIEIINEGASYSQTFHLENLVPEKISYILGTLTTTAGSVDDSNPQNLIWDGTIGTQQTITISYQALINPAVTGSIVNLFTLSAPGITPIQKHAVTSTPRPLLNTTSTDFIMPGTQPGITTDLIDSVDCKTCHTPEIYDRWRGSAMSQSGRDPLTWAALFNANALVPESGEFCLRCHTSTGWYTGRSTLSDGSSLLSSDIRNGVSCQLCHRMVDPIPSTSDQAVSIDSEIRTTLALLPPLDHPGSGMIILDPQDRRRGPFDLGTGFSFHTAYQTDFLSQSMDAIKESSVCGSCHNIDNPILSWDDTRSQYWPNNMDTAAPSFSDGDLFPIESTYDEWLFSDYASTGVFAPQFAGKKSDQIVRTCQDCHMTRVTGGAALPQFNPVYRDCQATGCLPEHNFSAANTWLPQLIQDPTWRLSSSADTEYLNHTRQLNQLFLRKAATLDVSLLGSGNNRIARISVTNETGHKLPTGYPEGRRMWIYIKAVNQSGEILFESGKYDWVLQDLIMDPYIKIYETKQGITSELASQLGVTSGESFNFILNNTILKDNRIPPRGVTSLEYNQPGLVPVGADYADNQYWDITDYPIPLETSSVTVILYYQVASKDYVQFLGDSGGYDGLVLESIWQSNPSIPEVMAIKFFPNYGINFPIIFR